MANRPAGLLLIFAGLALVVLGALVWLGAFRWFGHLPGDLRVERDGFRLYAPITSMLLLSLAASALLALLRRLL